MAAKLLPLLPPLLLAAAGLAGLLLLCVPTLHVREPPALKYGIVLDAGSSHTSMFVYKWPADKENETGVVSQHSSCHVPGGGISSYTGDLKGLRSGLEKCLDQALGDVPRDRHAGTPLYLGATAGMRLLNRTSPEDADRVLAEASRTLARYPFHFRGAHILSGQDEGVFGWVTANYLLESFIKCNLEGLWSPPRTGTLGAMDLGGASTQITFETDRQAEDPATEVQLLLYGRRYRLYTHSFLCYGRDQVLKMLLARAVQTGQSSHACWPSGYRTELKLQDLYASPCTNGQPPPASLGPSVSLEGSSEPGRCRALVATLFRHHPCNYSRCSFDGVFQPPVAGRFIAFSAFFYTVDFLRTTMRQNVSTPQELEHAVVTLCSQTWEQLQDRALPGHLKEKERLKEQERLRDHCAMATYVQQLLTQGYGFQERTFRGVTFQKKAGDTAVGWALGYMLNLTNMIPADPPRLRKGLNFSSWVVLLLIFVALVLAAIVLLLRQARSAKAPSVI